MSALACRTATLSDIRLMLDWAAQEGWNPGRDDAEAFHAADPEGFFVATDMGKPIAAISVVNHSEDFAFLGLYLCHPDYRGKGIGFGLWSHALVHAGDRTVGLDGVPEQEANYAKSGFVLADRTRRFKGRMSETDVRYPAATPEAFEALLNLDTAATGVHRPGFLLPWVQSHPTRKTLLLPGGESIIGFATGRICMEGCKIGPIVAPSAEIAFELAHQTATTLGQTDVMIDVPDTHPAFGQVLRDHGFIETFATARMYRGPAPAVGNFQQAIATMELG